MDHLPMIKSDDDRHEPCYWYYQGNFKFKIGRVRDKDLYLADNVKKQPRHLLEQIAAYDHAPEPDRVPLLDLVLRAITVVHRQYCQQFAPEKLTPAHYENAKAREERYLQHLAEAKATSQENGHVKVSDMVWSFVTVPEVDRGQAKVIRDALQNIGHGTQFDIGAEAVRLGLKTRQPPERIAYWYLHIWEKEGLACVK